MKSSASELSLFRSVDKPFSNDKIMVELFDFNLEFLGMNICKKTGLNMSRCINRSMASDICCFCHLFHCPAAHRHILSGLETNK